MTLSPQPLTASVPDAEPTRANVARTLPILRTVYQPTDKDCLSVDDFLDQFRGIVDVMGVEATLRMIDLFGGTRLYVPQRLREDSQLLALGVDVALKLVREFGLERIDVPILPFTPQALARLTKIRVEKGWDNAAIARSLNLSYRSVTRLAGKANERRPKGWAPGQPLGGNSDARLTRAGSNSAPNATNNSSQPVIRASGLPKPA